MSYCEILLGRKSWLIELIRGLRTMNVLVWKWSQKTVQVKSLTEILNARNWKRYELHLQITMKPAIYIEPYMYTKFDGLNLKQWADEC